MIYIKHYKIDKITYMDYNAWQEYYSKSSYDTKVLRALDDNT